MNKYKIAFLKKFADTFTGVEIDPRANLGNINEYMHTGIWNFEGRHGKSLGDTTINNISYELKLVTGSTACSLALKGTISPMHRITVMDKDLSLKDYDVATEVIEEYAHWEHTSKAKGFKLVQKLSITDVRKIINDKKATLVKVW